MKTILDTGKPEETPTVFSNDSSRKFPKERERERERVVRTCHNWPKGQLGDTWTVYLYWSVFHDKSELNQRTLNDQRVQSDTDLKIKRERWAVKTTTK